MSCTDEWNSDLHNEWFWKVLLGEILMYYILIASWVKLLYFFTESVYDITEEETYQFALKVKNKLDYNVTKNEMKTFIIFLLLGKCHTLPSDRG